MQPALKQKVRKGMCKTIRLDEQPNVLHISINPTRDTLLTCSDKGIVEYDLYQLE